jgi:DNA polymerase-3 subunit chi
MPEVIIHRLPGTKKALELCRLAEALYLGGKRLVVWVSDEGRAGILDDFLWTFAQHSFVPHLRWNGRDAEVEDPVVLVTGQLANPNEATVLIIADLLAEPRQAADFAEIHDLLTPAAEDTGKQEAWEAAGFAVTLVSGLGFPG